MTIKQFFLAIGGVFDGFRGTQLDGESQILKKIKSNSEDWAKYREAVEKLRDRRGDCHPEETITLSNGEEITLTIKK